MKNEETLKNTAVREWIKDNVMTYVQQHVLTSQDLSMYNSVEDSEYWEGRLSSRIIRDLVEKMHKDKIFKLEKSVDPITKGTIFKIKINVLKDNA